MKFTFVLLISLFSATTLVSQTIELPVSKRSILIDGFFLEEEWGDAHALKVSDSLTLYFKQDRDNIYWCLRGHHRVKQLASVDFYFMKGKTLVNLHVSAKLGERVFNGTDYGEWNWWNNRDWVANVLKLDVPETRTFFRDECKEFQVRKSFADGNGSRLMFTMYFPKNLETRFPSNASESDSEHWITLSW
jgi:hypothetical protein